jgi:hypothetical protein
MFFSAEPTGGGDSTGKGKGCDIGYALAISSCEGANSVEACTVTALDAITAFAVPNPNCPSQSRRFFQVWLPVGLPRHADHSAYFGLAKFYFSQPFQPSTRATLESCSKIVNALFQCNRPVAMDQNPETQPIESLLLNEWEIELSPLFHRRVHSWSKVFSRTARSVRRNQVRHLDAGRYVRHGWYQLTTQCQTSWPTSMAAHSGIPARLVLEW